MGRRSGVWVGLTIGQRINSSDKVESTRYALRLESSENIVCGRLSWIDSRQSENETITAASITAEVGRPKTS